MKKDIDLLVLFIFVTSLAFVVPAAYSQTTGATQGQQQAINPAPTQIQRSTTAQPNTNSLITIQTDKASLENGGVITVTGTAPQGKPVYLEVYAADKKVRASFFDNKPDKNTGKIPYILYMTYDMPAYYKIFVPKDKAAELSKISKEGGKWSVSNALKELGAEAAYLELAKMTIDHYQASILASIIGSRGTLLPPLDDKENRVRSMQLLKSRFKSPNKLFGAAVEVSPNGTFKADLKIRSGLAPGKYNIVAVVDQNTKSEPVSFVNNIGLPNIYLSNAGTSLNALWPFLLCLVISIFGVLMGAGGGFILNPLLVSMFPLPHTVVAGTVMPTVLFSQGSGIYNYSKIKFINWKLGISIGAAMMVGGFIGPKLTELITLAQFKFVFGWILLVLAGLMFWQTTPGYIAKNKKEKALLQEFKKRAAETAKAKQG